MTRLEPKGPRVRARGKGFIRFTVKVPVKSQD